MLFPLFLLVSFLNLASSDSTYDSLALCLSQNAVPKDQISKILYTQSSPMYTSVLQSYIRNSRFNTSSTPKPTLIITPLQDSHVQLAVKCCKDLGLYLKIRSGGHDYEGISYIADSSFLILDMFNLRSIDVNVNDETAWVQAGATLGELYYRIWEKSPVHGFPAGLCPTVAAGGHISGGGYGNMMRKFGLSVDHVVDARIVDSNGRILDRESMGEDLFWAIRGGGGGSYGVILAYKINLVRVPSTVTYFRVERRLAENATEAVLRWQLFADKTDDDLFIRMLLQPVSDNTRKGKRTIRATFIGLFLGESDRLMSIVDSDFPEMGLKKQDCLEMSWIRSVLYWTNFDNATSEKVLLDRNYESNFLKRKSDYVQTPISRDGLESLWKKMIELGKTGLVFNPYGGQMGRVPQDATPFPHRAGNLFKIQYSVNWQDASAASETEYISQIRKLYEFMAPFVSKNPRSAYLNYRDLDIGTTANGKNSYSEGMVYGEKYFGANFKRLVTVKSKVDPKNFFRNEQSIPVQPFRARRRM